MDYVVGLDLGEGNDEEAGSFRMRKLVYQGVAVAA